MQSSGSSAHIVYSNRSGVRYATVMRSVRTGKTTRKEKVLYLGRVLDAERGIYKNRTRGVFSFDPESMTFSPAPADFVETGKSCNAKEAEEGREECIVDFGDAFLLHELITRYGLDVAINALQYHNPDTLKALLIYCMLSSRSLFSAPAWYEGSYASILYPRADLTNISDLLALVGQEDAQQRFFDAYLSGLGPLREGANILVERRVDPCSVPFPTPFPDKHGELFPEVRLICVYQQGTGLPVQMRCVSDNESGASGIIAIAQELQARGIGIQYAIPDGSWLTERDMQELLEKKVPFITPCPAHSQLCRKRVAEHLGALEAPENLVLDADGKLFNGRRIYMKCVPVVCQGKELYAWIGKNMLAASLEDRRREHCVRGEKVDRQAFHEEGLWHGVFLFLASGRMRPEVLLSTWLAGQEAERLLASSPPPDIQSEEALRGYLLLNFIANALLQRLRLELQGSGHSLDEVLACMANQHAKVFGKEVIPARASHAQREIYDLLDVHPLAKYSRH